jgi:hypothetical protein
VYKLSVVYVLLIGPINCEHVRELLLVRCASLCVHYIKCTNTYNVCSHIYPRPSLSLSAIYLLPLLLIPSRRVRMQRLVYIHIHAERCATVLPCCLLYKKWVYNTDRECVTGELIGISSSSSYLIPISLVSSLYIWCQITHCLLLRHDSHREMCEKLKENLLATENI